ncbi:hypothetical protein Emed_002699 [Eimeria media]
MRQQLSQQQQEHRRQQEQLRHQQQQRQQQQSAGFLLQNCAGTGDRELSTRGLPTEPNSPQRLPSSEVLSLFAPSTRTPSPARRGVYSKLKERSQIRRACEAIPAPPARTPNPPLRSCKVENLESPRFSGMSQFLASLSVDVMPQNQYFQKQLKATRLAQPQENQRAPRRASEGGLPAVLTSHQDSTDTSTIFAELEHQNQQHCTTAGDQSEQIRGAEASAADIVHRQRPESQASGKVIDRHNDGRRTAPFETSNFLPDCHHPKHGKGKKSSARWKRRRSLAACHQIEDTAQCDRVASVALLNTAFGDGCTKVHASEQKEATHGGILHVESLLDLSPLLLAKMLQMLPAGAAKVFGSTCRKARRLLHSYCCIVSLSARDVSCLLSLSPAVLKRQVIFFLGVKTIDLELSPAVTSQMFLGSVAPAAAAVAGVSLRTQSIVYGRESPSSMNVGRETQALANQAVDSRERQNSGAERYWQNYQGRSRARDSAETARCEVAENQSLSRLPTGAGSICERSLNLPRRQPVLPDAPPASGDAQDAAVDAGLSPWSTVGSATASALLEHLTYLKSISARLKLAVTGSPGDSEAATELLLLLQQLIHRNAQSLVSLKIAVDVPPSSEPTKLLATHCLCSCTRSCGQRLWGRTSGKMSGCSGSPQTFERARTATVEICNGGFESLEAHMEEDALAAPADEAVTIHALAPAAETNVTAYLRVNDDCIAEMHKDGSLFFIRRKAKPAREPPRQHLKTGPGGLHFPGQAAILLRREAFILSGMSAISGGTALLEPRPSIHGRALEGHDAEASEASRENMIQAEPYHRGSLRLTTSVPGFPAARILRHPTVSMSSTVRQRHQQQQEKRIQQLLVRALQHLVEVAAESLQLLDVDGEVRHFSILHEKLHFKCLRRLSLGWTITPELHQLLCLFNSKQLRSLQKLNFNGPAQIHPDAYIHISYVSKASKIADENYCDPSWLEHVFAPLDEATLRRSAGLNNYGLGQIHLQLYALLNCGSCSVSQTDYARQQLVQQQFLLLKTEKKVSVTENDLQLDSSVVKHQEEFHQRQNPFGYANVQGSTSLSNSALSRKTATRSGSCRHRVHQAGSWLWRAFPSHFLGLAGPRAASVISPSTQAGETHSAFKETQSGSHLPEHFSSPNPQSVRESSNVTGKATNKPNHHKRCLAAKQGPYDLINKGQRPSPTGSDADNASEEAAAALAPRPKRRRLVSTHPATQEAARSVEHERIRGQLLEFTRKHLPLLGELIGPPLECLLNNSEILPDHSSSAAPLFGPRLDAAPEYEVQQGLAAVQLLKSVSSFLLEAAGDSLGLLLADAHSTKATNHYLPSRHSPSPGRCDRLTPVSATSSRNLCDDLHTPLTLPKAEYFGFLHHQISQEHGCFEQRELRRNQQQQTLQDQNQQSQQAEGKEVDELALLRLLQHAPLPRSTWSHGVFFKYAFVDLDFECLVTFRVCLCHHPLFIFYKEHEKGLHVLHVDGVFNPTGGAAQEKKELWKERLAYTYVCDPAAPFNQTTGHQENRRLQRSMQELGATPAGSEVGALSLRALRNLNSDERRTATSAGSPTAGVDRLADLTSEIDVTGDIGVLQKEPPPPQEGRIKLCSARASLCPVLPAKRSLNDFPASPLMPHVGPQMTGCDLFCLEMWAVLCLCRDQMAPPTLPQYMRALKRLWSETLTQQQRDIYDNIITPKYIARRLRTPDLTFEALPPWWQQQEGRRFSNGG